MKNRRERPGLPGCRSPSPVSNCGVTPPTAPWVLDAVKASDVVVVAGVYDHVESVLGALEVPHLLVQPQDLDRLQLRPEQLLIVNCPGQVSVAAVARIRAFVEAGGSLFTTDWGAQARHRAGVPRRVGVQQAAYARRRGPHRGQGPRQHLPAGRARRTGRPTVVARGRLVSHHRAPPGARPRAHHQSRAPGQVRRGAGGGVVPLGRGRRVPYDQSLLPAAHRVAHGAARRLGCELLHGEGIGAGPGHVGLPWTTCASPTSSRPSRRRRSWPTSSPRRRLVSAATTEAAGAATG